MFNIGDKIYCYNNLELYLTVGNYYKITDIIDNLICIHDNNGNEVFLPITQIKTHIYTYKRWFKTHLEIRKDKIYKIKEKINRKQ